VDSTVIINSTVDTTFGGTVNGTHNSYYLTLTKNGTGSLTLSGDVVNMARTTTENQGALLINSNNATFGDTSGNGTGTTAILVNNGGILGGNGTISPLAGDNVVIEDGGGLSPGALNQVGTLTFALGTGAKLDLSAMNTAGKLAFTLGTPSASDKIVLSSGFLDVGTLSSSEFSFTLDTGFGAGQYVLFDTSASIVGTIDTSPFALGGFTASLGLANGGQDLVLNVIPEPSAYLLLTMSLLFLVTFRRRRVCLGVSFGEIHGRLDGRPYLPQTARNYQSFTGTLYLTVTDKTLRIERVQRESGGELKGGGGC
jgi:hypothetical protein